MIATILLAAAIAPSPPPSPAPHYAFLPDEENWKSYCAPAERRRNALDRLKCVPLAADPNRYLTIGADVRVKYEHFFNKDWNASNSGYLLERELLDADVHLDRVRAFVQLEHAAPTDRHAPIDATWRDDVAATSAYLEYAVGGATGASGAPVTVRAGRQLLAYGSERMIDDRYGLNTEQAFDGARARISAGAWQTDLFAVRPVTVNPLAFDDLPDRTKALLGAYATRHAGTDTLDVYALEDQRQSQFYYRGVAPEERWTLGARFASASPCFDSDTEIDKQFGSFGSATIDAYAIETSLGYDFGRGNNRFRAGVGGGIASGDHDPTGRRLQIFRAPYPTGLTFGIIEANGNENTAGFTPNVSYTYAKKLTVAVKTYFFYRQSALDGVYSAAGFPLRGPGDVHASPLGDLGYVAVTDQLDRHVTVAGAYARYLIGRYLASTPQTRVLPSLSTAYYTLWWDVRI